MAVREAEDRLSADAPASRRNNTSLQGTATTIMAAREVGEDVTMRAVLSWFIDTAASAFNLAFLMITETAAASQRCLLLTRKCQNKLFIILQE
ncbi:hypothetical protein BDBG_16237 [Blastomyces gilchristii SLH14081]|uniref:Uncharacterized protein n=1 Tax=Blastomyces gilchristii (strain SLH14081) TaxID=559298 RepID=A0A179U9E4_BLAGS|nr:uncharacterized protein BDBG_16237 [Blastomyces gilchristii SLH14081]OAT04353.1 hypothetical protein BDBG_16237 [Blastomyces gilchristii SLH14081]